MSAADHRTGVRVATALVVALLLGVTGGSPVTPALATGTPSALPSFSTSAGDRPTYVAVATRDTSCAIRTGGLLDCWGGDGTLPRGPAGRYRAVSVWGDRACAVREDRALACWAAPGWELPAPPPGAFDSVGVTGVAACAISVDGSIACWGTGPVVADAPTDGTYRSLSVGAGRACAIRTDTELRCWGDGPPAPVGRFRAVAILDDGCAVRTDGSLACWGPSYGTGSAPQPVPTGTFVAVSVGSTAACAIRDDGRLACWPHPRSAEEEEYDDDGEAPAAPRPPSGRYATVAGTGCAITVDGELRCFGGLDTPRPLVVPSAMNPWVATATATLRWDATPRFARIVRYQVRARYDEGEGRHGPWQLLAPTRHRAITVEVRPGMTMCVEVRAVDAEGTRSRWTPLHCVTRILDDRFLARSAGWREVAGGGYSEGGALRATRLGARLTLPAARVYELALVATVCPGCGVVQVHLRGEKVATVSLDAPRTIRGRTIELLDMDPYQDWPEGETEAEEFVPSIARGTVTITVVSVGRPVVIEGLVVGRTADRPAWATAIDPSQPARYASPDRVLAIDTSTATCAVRRDGRLGCWGRGWSGTPVPPAGRYTSVAVTADGGCAVRRDGALDCWSGESELALVTEPRSAVALSSSSSDVCALLRDGTTACSGSTDGEDTFRPPTGTFTAIAGGRCGLRPDGSIFCWDPLRDELTDEVMAAPAGAFRALDVGAGHGCAIRRTGSVTCWGGNASGQATAPRGAFRAIAVGDAFSCGIRVNGSLACWGSNRDLVRETPSGAFTALAAGDRQACAVRASGRFVCWGHDGRGAVTPRPAARILARVPAVATAGTMRLRWTALGLHDASTSDVRIRRAAFGHALGAWSILRRDATGSSVRAGVRAGATVCLSVRVRDTTGLASAWSPRRCSTAPVTESVFGRSAGWAVVHRASLRDGTAVRATRRGAILVLPSIDAADVRLLLRHGPGYGAVEVRWNGEEVTELDLGQDDTGEPLRTRVDSWVRLGLADSGLGGQGTLTIRVTSSGRPVVVDGVVVVPTDGSTPPSGFGVY